MLGLPAVAEGYRAAAAGHGQVLAIAQLVDVDHIERSPPTLATRPRTPLVVTDQHLINTKIDPGAAIHSVFI